MQCAGLGTQLLRPAGDPTSSSAAAGAGAPTGDRGGVGRGREMRSSFVWVHWDIPSPLPLQVHMGGPSHKLCCAHSAQALGRAMGHLGQRQRLWLHAGSWQHKGHLVQTGPAALADDNGPWMGDLHLELLGSLSTLLTRAQPPLQAPLPWSSPSHGAMGAGEGSLLWKREPAPAPPRPHISPKRAPSASSRPEQGPVLGSGHTSRRDPCQDPGAATQRTPAGTGRR